ncbi:2OG-Fe(II) oxygenase [Acidihalobacter prosperus]|uniref:Fe2OG dioxygenase domain-containing protein n=1 Tax=Acidihalobacter prosperus TaxID=160660 RepID=A0A1A6C1Q7_9GAMM|nr:2OG-Fe(II) oxygenase [Acidihalobacter prosperus]OBS08484.1 hypothetical protein Thpro_022734 [Acidihalobacter prosperus]
MFLTFGFALATLGLAYAMLRFSRQQTRLGRLAAALPAIRDWQAGHSLSLPADTPAFSTHLARLHDCLPPESLYALREACLAGHAADRSLIPGHKRGGTLSYDTLLEVAPAVIGLYLSEELQALCSRIVGASLMPVPVGDQSACSVLLYERSGDHIGWHYDHDFYRGRHFTVLLSIENRGNDRGGVSSAWLEARRGESVERVPTPPNTLVIFEGCRVRHRVTPLARGERRVLVSMTYCTDPSASLLADLARRAKDMAYFGPRALWI